MTLNKTKAALSMLVLSAISISFVSNAEEFSAASTKAVALTFNNVTHSTYVSIQKEGNLPQAGVPALNETLLFTSTATAKVGADSTQMGTRFTPNLPSQINVTNNGNASDEQATLVGVNNPNHTIAIKMVDKPASSSWIKSGKNGGANTPSGSSMLVSTTGQQVITYGLDGTQTLEADDYTASIDSALYYK